jgi:hypothetical protein
MLMNELLRKLPIAVPNKQAYRIESLRLSGCPVTSAVFRSTIKYMHSVFKKEILKA